MTEAELVRTIKQTVRMELAQTLLGSVTGTDNAYIASVKRFSTDSEIGGLRLIRPWGFTSRPPEDTTTVVHPVNGDASHLMSLGDFDEGNRPSISQEESAVYGSDGQLIHLKANGDIVFGDYIPATGTILPTQRAKFHNDGSFELGGFKSISSNALGETFIGSTSADSPLVLGDILQTFCDQLITILSTALTSILTGPIAITTTPGNPAPTSPTVIAALTNAVTQLTLLQTQYVDAPVTNFLSLTNFTERGI